MRTSHIIQTKKWTKLAWGHMACIGDIRNSYRILVGNPELNCELLSSRPNPSGRTMALGSTQPLTEMSTRNLKKKKERKKKKEEKKETWG
jgi:hypothetical protein